MDELICKLNACSLMDVRFVRPVRQRTSRSPLSDLEACRLIDLKQESISVLEVISQDRSIRTTV
jgi:hypothetical protein